MQSKLKYGHNVLRCVTNLLSLTKTYRVLLHRVMSKLKVTGRFVITWRQLIARCTSVQQVRICCPLRPATYVVSINKYNGGKTQHGFLFTIRFTECFTSSVAYCTSIFGLILCLHMTSFGVIGLHLG